MLVAGHAAWLLAAGSLSRRVALDLARDFTLIVLIQWLVQWFSSTYNSLRRRVLPAK